MATEELLQFMPPFIALALLFFGFRFKEAILGIFGGVLLFIFGVSILMTPLLGVASLTNTLVGSVTFGVGAYIWLRGGYEMYAPILNNIQN